MVRNDDVQRQSDWTLPMQFLKTEFTRFFAIGFIGGAALIMGVMGLDAGTDLANGLIPAAHAAVAG